MNNDFYNFKNQTGLHLKKKFFLLMLLTYWGLPMSIAGTMNSVGQPYSPCTLKPSADTTNIRLPRVRLPLPVLTACEAWMSWLNLILQVLLQGETTHARCLFIFFIQIKTKTSPPVRFSRKSYEVINLILTTGPLVLSVSVCPRMPYHCW